MNAQLCLEPWLIVTTSQTDLQDYQSVKAFAKRAETLRRLDAVVENAGICACIAVFYRTTTDMIQRRRSSRLWAGMRAL